MLFFFYFKGTFEIFTVGVAVSVMHTTTLRRCQIHLGHDWPRGNALQPCSILEGLPECKGMRQHALPRLQGSVVDDVQAIGGLMIAQRCQGVTIAAEAGMYDLPLPFQYLRG